MGEIDISSLPVLDYPALTEDLEEAKANIDESAASQTARRSRQKTLAATAVRPRVRRAKSEKGNRAANVVGPSRANDPATA